MVRRQRVQTLALRHLPFSRMLVFLVLGIQARLVLRLEWLTLCPDWGPLPQISHLATSTPFDLISPFA